MTLKEPFFLKPVKSKYEGIKQVVVVVYNDARASCRVENLIRKYAKIKQRNYISIEDRNNNPVDRIAIYVLEDVISDRTIKSILKNIEATGKINIIIKTC